MPGLLYRRVMSASGERKIPGRQKSRPLVRYSGFNFARWSESPSVHCTQPYRRAGNPPSSLHSDCVVVCQRPRCTALALADSFVSPCGLGTHEHSSRYHGFACQPLRGLVTSRYGEVSNTFQTRRKKNENKISISSGWSARIRD